MNRLGMMVDVSHVADTTFADVLRVSSSPVVASHSGARALTDAPRNLTDDMIRAIAAGGGAIMVNFYPAFIDEAWRKAWNALAPERDEDYTRLRNTCAEHGDPVTHALSNAVDRSYAARIPRPPLSSLIDHVDHICQIAGPGHVGLGSDFDGICSLPEGLNSAADLPVLEDALSQRGYTDQQIRGILGENLLRVMRLVEQSAS